MYDKEHPNTMSTPNVYSVQKWIGDLSEIRIDEIVSAILRINQAVGWTHDNDEIFNKIATEPDMCYIAILNDIIVGYCILRLDGEDSHIHISYLATDHQRSGVGTSIISEVINKSQERGDSQITLHHRDDQGLISFYDGIGERFNLNYTRIVDNNGCRVIYRF